MRDRSSKVARYPPRLELSDNSCRSSTTLHRLMGTLAGEGRLEWEHQHTTAGCPRADHLGYPARSRNPIALQELSRTQESKPPDEPVHHTCLVRTNCQLSRVLLANTPRFDRAFDTVKVANLVLIQHIYCPLALFMEDNMDFVRALFKITHLSKTKGRR